MTSSSHPLTKLPFLSRVFRFSCSKPKAPFLLAQVTSTWRETLVDPEWGCADALFESLADANNKHLSEDQVKGFWRGAAKLLERESSLCPELIAALNIAIDGENKKALAEFQAGDGATVAKHRRAQQMGTLAVVFRGYRKKKNEIVSSSSGSRRQRDQDDEENEEEEEDEFQGVDVDEFVAVEENWEENLERFMHDYTANTLVFLGPFPTQLCVMDSSVDVMWVDLQRLPGSLKLLSFTSCNAHVGPRALPAIFSDVATASPDIYGLAITGCNLTGQFSCDMLSGMSELRVAALYTNNLSCNNGLKLGDLPAKLEKLQLGENRRLCGDVDFAGGCPESLREVNVWGTQIAYPSQVPAGLKITGGIKQ